MSNKSVRIKSEFDKIVKEEIDHILEENDRTDILNDDDMRRLGAQLPPEDMRDRIMKACKDDKKIRRRNIKRIFIIAAIIAVLASGTGVMAYRFFDVNLFARISKHSVRIVEAGGEAETFKITENDAYSEVEEKLGVKLMRPKYIPKGFYLSMVKLKQNSKAEIVYSNSSDDTIKIIQEKKFESSGKAAFIDSTSSFAKVEEVGNIEVMFVEYVQDETSITWVNAMWSDDSMTYKITSEIEKEEIKKIISEME